MSEYKYGSRKDFQFCEFLERRSYKWRIAKGSRSPIDVIAKKGRRKWGIQVKATRKNYISYTRLTIDEENKLIRIAKRKKATSILALVTKNYVWFVTVPDEKLMLRGKLKPLQYEYNT